MELQEFARVLEDQRSFHSKRLAGNEMRSNREIVLAAVRRLGFGVLLRSVSVALCSTCRVLSRDGVALAYASEELRGDAEVLAAAVWKPG